MLTRYQVTVAIISPFKHYVYQYVDAISRLSKLHNDIPQQPKFECMYYTCGFYLRKKYHASTLNFPVCITFIPFGIVTDVIAGLTLQCFRWYRCSCVYVWFYVPISTKRTIKRNKVGRIKGQKIFAKLFRTLPFLIYCKEGNQIKREKKISEKILILYNFTISKAG